MRMKNLLLTALLLLVALRGVAAEDFAYVYIQGDKQTPFYVKLEDGMQPRYGKNYCILSRLAPGPANIEILFQQNIYPAQKFAIQVPERGSREFMIVRRDGAFSLYDLQQNFYLAAGNSVEDDHAPAVVANATSEPVLRAAPAGPPRTVEVAPVKQPKAPKSTEPGVFSTGVKKTGEALAKGRDRSAEFAKNAVKPLRPAATQAQTQKTKPAEGKPTFIGDLELSTPNTDPSTTRATTSTATAPVPAAIANSDCPNAISSSEFSKVFNGLSSYNADEERLEYFGKQLDKCYETWQARTLAGKLQGDAARYELLRKIYPRITDQGSFPLLDDLLSAPAWKEAFNRLVHR
jgi:hypothetical protein